MLFTIVISFVVVWMTLPIMLGFSSLLVKFWTRNRHKPEYASVLIKHWWEVVISREIEQSDWDGDYDGGAWIFVIFHFTVGCIMLGVVKAVDVFDLWAEFGFVGIAIVLLILPRYILDIANSIQYSFKSRKSIELENIRAELEDLKNKMK